MTELHPIVYTRPFDKDDDFRFFARPKSLVGDAYFVERMRNVLATESYRGGIKGKRWHVLRTKDSIVIGFATQEFERYDDVHGRRLRGYYGFEMSSLDFCLPDLSLFCALDEIIVKPLFHTRNLQERDFGIIHSPPFDDQKLYRQVLDVNVAHKFNTTDTAVVNYIPVDVRVDELLKEAIVCASRNDKFECVIGLNKRKHAEESRVLNCVCYEQPTALRVRVHERHSEAMVKNGSSTSPDIITKKEESLGRESLGSQNPGFVRKVGRKVGELLFGTGRQTDCSYRTESKSDPTRERMVIKGTSSQTKSATEMCGEEPLVGSVVAAHHRGWNVSKSPQAPTLIRRKEEDADKNVMKTQDRIDLADVVAKLASLHTAWYKLNDSDEKHISLRDMLANILCECGAIQIANDKEFDPIRHEDAEGTVLDKDAHIMATLAPGWMYCGGVLEKALVKRGDMPSHNRVPLSKEINRDEMIQEA